MRERSHKKGETYLRAVKHWLVRTSFLGFDAELFGDAYDVTKKACTIGGIVFDFSLTLRSGEVARHILYAECKYRNERSGDVDTEFRNFLKHVYDALAGAETDDADCALFVFISNIPPRTWREFLKNKRKFCQQLDWEPNRPDGQVLDRILASVHVLVLSEQIVERS
jgi:hypothetical protein